MRWQVNGSPVAGRRLEQLPRYSEWRNNVARINGVRAPIASQNSA